MNATIHANLDADAATICQQLRAQLGWDDAEIVRRGIMSLATLVESKPHRQIIGVGQYDSGVDDLGSNKSYLDGFGQDSLEK